MKKNSQEVEEKNITEEEREESTEPAEQAPQDETSEENQTGAGDDQDQKKSDEEKAADLMLKMKDKIEKKEAEVSQLKDLLMRRQADFENYKKQSARQAEINKRMLIKDLAVDIIGINDNLIRASEAAVHVPEGENLEDAHKSYVEGVMMISKSIEEMLSKYGIEEIDAMEQHFDPNVHEAVEISMSEDVSQDTVTKVFQKGFKLDDFILRTSKVCVTKAMPKPAAKEDNGEAVSEGGQEKGAGPQEEKK